MFFFLVFVMRLCVSVYLCLVVNAGKGLTSWLSFVVSYCKFVTFPFGILGQVWYLIESIPVLCTLTYFEILCKSSVSKPVFSAVLT